MISKSKYILETFGLVSSLLATLVSVLITLGHIGISTVVLGVIAVVTATLAAIYVIRRRVNPEYPKRIFIIYARADLKLAKKVSEELAKAGFEPWLDVEQIRVGQRWSEVIDEALSQSGGAVAILTKEFSKSSLAGLELEKALDFIRPKHKDAAPIIPIVLEGAEIPESLRDIQQVSSIEATDLKRLIAGLRYATDISGSAG